MTMRTIIEAATVWQHDREPLIGATVVVEHGFITSVGDPAAAAQPGLRVNANGRWLLPGFINAHTQLFGIRSNNSVHWVTDAPNLAAYRAVGDLRRSLAAGFTTLREAGGPYGPALRDAVAQGEVTGPRIVPSYLGLSGTGGGGDVTNLPIKWVRERSPLAMIVDGEDEVRKAVRTVARAGGEWVKIWSERRGRGDHKGSSLMHFAAEELVLICAEAHGIGMKVGVEAQSSAAIIASLKAGVDVLEHGYRLTDDAIALMLEREVVLVPSLAALVRRATADHERGDNDAMSLLSDARKSVARAARAGVRIAVGADNLVGPIVGVGRAIDELAALRDAGLSVEECMSSLTVHGAAALGLEGEVGVVRQGARGDLVLLAGGDPRENIERITDPNALDVVFVGGEPVAGSAVKSAIALDDSN